MGILLDVLVFACIYYLWGIKIMAYVIVFVFGTIFMAKLLDIGKK